MDGVKGAFAWVYAAGMAILTAIAEGATALEPDRLVWMLGLSGGLIGAALLPSTQAWRTVVKALFGWIIAGVMATPMAASHLAPAFVNVHVAALWLGFAGPGLFVATTEGSAILTKFLSRGKAA